MALRTCTDSVQETETGISEMLLSEGLLHIDSPFFFVFIDKEHAALVRRNSKSGDV